MPAASEKKFLHALALSGAECDALAKLEEAFGSYKTAWRAAPSSLTAAGISQELASRIAENRERLNPDEALRSLVQSGIALVAAGDPEYPQLLAEIPVPPRALYIKGRVRPERPRLAVVGTRKATSYGLSAVQKIIRELADEAEIEIVSGLAQGIDGAAHRVALASGLTATGVLGGGMDRQSFFPPEHWTLGEEITGKGGAVISEYPPGAPALKHHFLARNRIIAGLSLGVLVIEAPSRSGALNTANHALEQGREVFAVPSQMWSPNAEGTHRLIQTGAKLVTRAEDILEELSISRRPRGVNITPASMDETERALLKLLGEPKNVDELKEATRLSTPEVITRLSALELKGFVRPMGQNRFQRIA